MRKDWLNKERERFLTEQGWKVYRYHGDEIRGDAKKVVDHIRSIVTNELKQVAK